MVLLVPVPDFQSAGVQVDTDLNCNLWVNCSFNCKFDIHYIIHISMLNTH